MKCAITQIFTLLLLITLAVPALASKVLADIEYFYADDGTLIGKAFNGKRVNFEYDLRGQLLAVKDTSGKDLERYTYDPAGNRLSKTINGLTTTYTYDKANQLVTSTVNGVTTHYKYDAAGRMIQAGDKKYIYNGNNKVVAIWQNGDIIAKFEYNVDGQISKAIYGDKVEEFMWDGLALIWRSGVTYINEPNVTGGNPVMAGDAVLFNDMLGNTLAVNGKAVEMSSFGETADKNAFFTGKPMIDELGYSFLFRDYNPNHGKWTTSDPLGYPDGWNNLAYVNNGVTVLVDWLGAATLYTWPTTFSGLNIENWGHSAMQLEDKNKTYVSWWPSVEVTSITTVPGVASTSYKDDYKSEGNTDAKYVKINGLDEEAMAKWYNEFSTQKGQTWGTIGQNCAWTTAHTLMAGMTDPCLADLKKDMEKVTIWTPQNVSNYVNKIKKKLE